MRNTATGIKKLKHRQVSSGGDAVAHLASVADAMHALLVKRADELMGCVEGSPEEAELATIATPSKRTKPRDGLSERSPVGKASHIAAHIFVQLPVFGGKADLRARQKNCIICYRL